ncbi:MAG: PadR family transcriptional regulator [Granulicella sp.]
MNKSFFLGEFEQIVLLAILRLEEFAYGVTIRAEIHSCAGRKTTPGALYTTLDRLERKGLLSSRSGESTPARGGRAKRFYSVTTEGRQRLVNAQSAFHRLLGGLNLLEGEGHG